MVKVPATVLGFDVYGTLFDVDSLSKKIGDPSFIALWRRKQLEYTWFLTIMGKWMSFREVTRLALEYSLAQHPIRKSMDYLMGLWEELEPFSDVEELKKLIGIKMYCLTNGDKSMIQPLLKRWGLSEVFAGVYSAEDVRAYKPSPLVYQGFLRYVGERACLVSANPFDVAGAKNAGMCAIYVNRRNIPLELGFEADLEVKDLRELVNLYMKEHQGSPHSSG